MEIPSWLFFGLYQGKWTEEKEKTAQRILHSLKLKSETEYWPPEIIETVLKKNKDDNHSMY